MDDMRKAFEAWAAGSCGLSAEFFPDGSYTDGRLRSMWEAWQAATLAERERCKVIDRMAFDPASHLWTDKATGALNIVYK